MVYLTLLDVLNEVNKWRVKNNLKIDIPSTSLKTKQTLLHENSIEYIAMKTISTMCR